MILVTGGGFIGANFVFDLLARSDVAIINLDVLINAGNRENLV
jgi:dTDP-D-glucose 4,6-dehydratase